MNRDEQNKHSRPPTAVHPPFALHIVAQEGPIVASYAVFNMQQTRIRSPVQAAGKKPGE